jgi:hypothetical protein
MPDNNAMVASASVAMIYRQPRTASSDAPARVAKVTKMAIAANPQALSATDSVARPAAACEVAVSFTRYSSVPLNSISATMK